MTAFMGREGHRKPVDVGLILRAHLVLTVAQAEIGPGQPVVGALVK